MDGTIARQHAKTKFLLSQCHLKQRGSVFNWFYTRAKSLNEFNILLTEYTFILLKCYSIVILVSMSRSNQVRNSHEKCLQNFSKLSLKVTKLAI